MPRNRFDEIKIGDSFTLEKTICTKMVQCFSELTGDYNPSHVDDTYCIEHGINKTVHGLLTTSFISAIIGMHLPGEGSTCILHNFEFIRCVRIGDNIKITSKVIEKSNTNLLKLNIVTLKHTILNQDGDLVIRGLSKVAVN